MDVISISKSGKIELPDSHILIESAISGGTYQTYLQDMMFQFDNKVCLYLNPVAHRFALPCYDGQGVPLTEAEATEIIPNTKYSAALCCNWYFRPEPPTMFLVDTDFSLRKKVEVAEAVGVPFLYAEISHIKKLRLPD